MLARIIKDQSRQILTPSVWIDIIPSKKGIFKKESLTILIQGVDSPHFSYKVTLDRLSSLIFKYGGFDYFFTTMLESFTIHSIQSILSESVSTYLSPISRGEKNAYIVGLLNALRFDRNFRRKATKAFGMDHDNNFSPRQYFSSNLAIDDRVVFSSRVNKFVKSLGIMQ